MRTFIFTVLIIWCISIAARLLLLMISDYPRTEKTSMGGEVARILISTGFTVWAGFLLWGPT